MRLSAEWLRPRRDDAPEVANTLCRLTIEVGGKVVTRLFDTRDQSTSQHVVVPASVVAEALAKRWWWLVAGRSGRFNLRHGRQGFALPDLTFSPDGVALWVAATHYEYSNPPVEFLLNAQERVPTPAFEDVGGAFIETVVARLTDKGVRDTFLHERWGDIQRGRADAEERAFCEAAGALGVDPYLCSDADAAAIEDAGREFSGTGLEELLADHSVEEVAADLAWMRMERQSVGDRASLPALAEWGDDVRRTLPEVTPAVPGWEIGYRAATAARKLLNRAEDSPLKSVADLAALGGSRDFTTAAKAAVKTRAAILDTERAPRILVGGYLRESPRAFALARAMGDWTVYGDDGPRPITDTQSSHRQAVGRAFAAEFLAPAETVLAMREARKPVDDIAEFFGVDTNVVEKQIENRSRIAAVR